MAHTTNTSSVRLKVTIATFAGLVLTGGCALDDQEIDGAEDEARVAAALGQSGNVVTAWATIAADAIVRPVEAEATLRPPGHSSMLMAQVQLAVYDVMTSIDDEYEPFSYSKHCVGRVDRDAAVVTAAYRVLRTRVPGRAAYLDQQYETSMAAIPSSRRKTDGIALGEDVAAHYIALRANDNVDNTYTWVQPTPGPGVFEPVAPTQPVDYKMVFAQPFTFSVAQSPSFFPPPPPALTSSTYTTAWKETRDLGRANGTIRTEAQRQLALWTAENAFRWASRNQVELAVAKGLSMADAARYFALTWTAGADGFQTGMSAKYAYNYWRPFHSIPRADTDGNPATDADTTWAPTLNVNHPEYPAGHGFFGAGTMVEATRAFFRTDNVNWTLSTVGVAGLTETARTYNSLNALSKDVGDARVLAGLHYRFSVDEGRTMGKRVVQHITSRHFRRRGRH